MNAIIQNYVKLKYEHGTFYALRIKYQLKINLLEMHQEIDLISLFVYSFRFLFK